jgi:nitroreductase
METLECIKTRRSRRQFIKKEVSKELINKLIEAAINAPSSLDCQPWEFIIVKREEAKKRLGKLKGEDNYKIISEAPMLIIVCVNTEKSPSRAVEDGVAATENLLLAAHELGLGSVYISGFKIGDDKFNHSVQNALNLPKNILPITILPIGYLDPNEELEEKDIKDIKDVLHFEKW